MRAPLMIVPALLLWASGTAPAAAQVKADLGAGATLGTGSPGAVGSSLGGAGVSPIVNLGVAPLTGAPSLSGYSAPGAKLSPAAASTVLPAAALAPATQAAPADGSVLPSAKKAAAPVLVDPPSSARTNPAAGADEIPSPPVEFVVALRGLGVPEPLVARLYAFLLHRHPGDLNAIYHGLAHSYEVAGFTSRILQGQDMPVGRKVLLILSGALHDIDPERVPDTPARVSATLSHLDADPEARALLADFESRYGFTTAQVKALIMATDFSMIPAEMQAKQDAFAKAAAEAFPGEDFGLVWGRRLAFVDQTATYLGPVEEAQKRVRGLALEIRAASGMLGGKGPTDEQILAGTAKFLAVLRQNPEFSILSPDLQSKFAKVQTYFEARQTPEAWASPAAPAPTRAPPDLERALRYIRSVAGGAALDGRKTDGLLALYFEENGIREGSDRAEAVRRALVPDRAAADDAAMRGVSTPLLRRRAILLRLAARHGTTPAAIEEVLRRREVLPLIVGVKDELFETQTELALTRDERERFVSRYPENEQGEFMRGVADAMSTVGGKSVEEVARDGVFAYVDFYGGQTVRARPGRDPDDRHSQMVFYITRPGRRWRIRGYRQNKDLGRNDSELIDRLKRWLTAGGIPAEDLE